MFSRTSAYAIRALLRLAAQPPGRLVGELEISERERVPRSFLYKVLQQLRRGKLLRSYRGVNGGYQLACPPDRITLLQVVRCMEGDRTFTHCILEDKPCGRYGECVLHLQWVRQWQGWMDFLDGQTLEMVRSRRSDKNGVPVDKELANTWGAMAQETSGASNT
jgi:Rrf2 family protein